MAKELPYFKFYTSEWLDGDITIENLEAQGLFINICALYWSKEGNVFIDKLRKRFHFASDDCLDSLIKEGFITVGSEGKIEISFLNEQFGERVKLSSKNSLNGKKGGRPKNPNKTQTKPTALVSLTQTKANESNIEERREEERREELLNNDLSLKVQEIIKRFDQTNFENTERTFESTKEKIKLRLIEFLEIEQITEQFENRPKGEVLKHFRNWMNYNPPVKSKRKVTDSVPWLTKDITGLVKPDDTLKQKRQDRWDDFEKRRETDPNAVY